MRLFLQKIGLVPQPEAVFLIGPPGSGKSTYIKNLKEQPKYKKYAICSTDNYIETIAKIRGKNYHEMFQELIEPALKNFLEHIDIAIENNVSFFVDRTNCSSEDRKLILDKIPPHYFKKGVIFHHSREELQKRIMKRYETTGKLIEDEVLDRIIAKYEHPSKTEFDVLLRA